jgi:hypothetical protein
MTVNQPRENNINGSPDGTTANGTEPFPPLQTNGDGNTMNETSPNGTHSRTASSSALNGLSPISPTQPTPREDRLIVGVDFGTTYSGVAAVFTGTPEDIDIIKTWPGGNGITSDKVPTEIAYVLPLEAGQQSGRPSTAPTPVSPIDGAGEQAPEKDPSRPEPTKKWGFQFRPEEPRLRCIKLFLDRNQKLPHFVSPLETAAQLRKCDRTVMDAVSDYLTRLYRHTMETLTRRYGESFVSTTPVEFVLTVPAVWSDAAKNATLQAAERAGMGRRHELKLISEPEAAAVYTLRTLQPASLRVGGNFIVCDAGGGTVDLIAYRITSLSPLRVEESAVGTGGLCGSAFLNYRFEDFVKARLGADRFQTMREKKPKTWMMGLRYFEEFVKRNFSDEEDGGEVNVPLPGLPDDEEAGLDSGFLVMSKEEVKAIFEPVVRQVIELVEGQVRDIRARGNGRAEVQEDVSGIILVGGFGQSNYLYTRLKRHFNEMVPPPAYTETPTHAEQGVALQQQQSVEVLQPLHAWTAVVRGAVLRGIEGSLVEKRKSRFHYGTSYATVFDESKHPVADRYWSPLWERWMVSDRMQWHISKVMHIPPFSCGARLPELEADDNGLCRAPPSPPKPPSASTTRATSGPINRSSSKTNSSLAISISPPMLLPKS